MSGSPVVEVGATVTVRDEATGAVRTWRLVTEKSTAGAAGELTAGTPVGQALLGHMVGDTVESVAAKRMRLVIVDIVPAPPVPAAVPRPLPDATILAFSRGQDHGYREWARTHPGGYVLVYANGRGYMIHTATCGHLGLDADWTLDSTPPSRPRLCSTSRTLLVHRSQEETGARPVSCGTCG